MPLLGLALAAAVRHAPALALRPAPAVLPGHGRNRPRRPAHRQQIPPRRMVLRPVRPRPRPGRVPPDERRRARRPWVRPVRAVADAHSPEPERVEMGREPPTRPVADTVVPHWLDRVIVGVDDEKFQAGSGERSLEQIHPHPTARLGTGHGGRADTDPRRQLPLAQVRPPARPAHRAGDVEARVHACEPRCPTPAAESAPTNLWTTNPPVHDHLTTPPAAVPRRAGPISRRQLRLRSRTRSRHEATPTGAARLVTHARRLRLCSTARSTGKAWGRGTVGPRVSASVRPGRVRTDRLTRPVHAQLCCPCRAAGS